MKRVINLFILLVGVISTHGQCSLVVSAEVLSSECYGMTVHYSSTGGIPPYDINVISAGGTLETVVGGQTGSSTFLTSFAAGDVLVQVTDGAGCYAEAAGLNPTHHDQIDPQFYFEMDCVTGQQSLKLDIGVAGFSSCIAAGIGTAEYTIYRKVQNDHVLYSTGQLAGNWTLESSGQGLFRWRFNPVLPAGRWVVELAFSRIECPFGDVACINTNFEQPLSQTYTFDVIGAGDCGVNLNVRAALGGALRGTTLMSDDLRAGGLVPLVEPYAALGYGYVGAFSDNVIQQSFLNTTGPDAIVDWVILEFRNATAPYAVLFSRPALIQRDGDLMDVDGDPHINVPLTQGTFRIAIRHRNHLGVMSGPLYRAYPLNTIVDLSNSFTTTYGTNAQQNINGVMALWPGDANNNGTVIYTGSNNDRDLILTAIGGTTPTNTVTNTYSPLDINMDGTIRYTGTNNDRDIILETIGGVVPTATRAEQLP
ncbi:MAG TPA: hypothetical protein PLE71_17530 [Flavobacteriales bacterium]|nr:hypothetical protein [Flavobacteriales bacterium]